MANEHESLVEAVTAEIRNQDTLTDEELANVIVCLIAERTKEATEAMCDGINSHAPEAIWQAMQARSALYPPVLPTQAQQMESGE